MVEFRCSSVQAYRKYINSLIMSLIRTGVIWLLALSAAPAEPMQAKFEAILRRVEGEGVAVITSPPSIAQLAEWKGEVKDLNPEVSVPALVKLWLAGGQQDFVLLEWWRKRNNASLSRVMIVALFECVGDEPTSAKPDFKSYAERYDEDEQKMRGEEIDLVLSQRKQLAAELAKLLKATDARFRSKEAADLLHRYEQFSAK